MLFNAKRALSQIKERLPSNTREAIHQKETIIASLLSSTRRFTDQELAQFLEIYNQLHTRINSTTENKILVSDGVLAETVQFVEL